MGRRTQDRTVGRGAHRGRHVAVLTIAVGLVVAGPSAALAQSATEVPLWPAYPADLLPIPDTMSPRLSQVCVSVEQLYGDLASGAASQLGSYGEAPVRAYYHVGLLTDLDAPAVTGAFRPYLDRIEAENDQPT